MQVKIFLEDKHIMVAEEMWQKSYCAHPTEIINQLVEQATEKIIGTQRLVVSNLYCINIVMENQETTNRKYPWSAKLLSNKLLKCYSNAFTKHWDNTGTICLDITLQTWGMFLLN